MPASKRIRGGPPAAAPKRRARHAIPQTNSRRVELHAGFVQHLTQRFCDDPDLPDLPLIVVNRIPQTRTVHILVVWDLWKDLTIPQRARVIADAFAAAHPDQDLAVTFPIGLTPGEALRQGFLPYQITPVVRPEDRLRNEELNEALRAAGGVLIQVGDDVQLRFATRGQANRAYRRLLERINKPIWTISEEFSNSESGDVR